MRRLTSEINPPLLRELVHALRRNPTLEDAADACGVHPKTLIWWVKQGLLPNPERPYAILARWARKARASYRGELFNILRTEAHRDWKIAQYLLERSDKELLGEHWAQAIPQAGESKLVTSNLFERPSPELLRDLTEARWVQLPLGMTAEQVRALMADGHAGQAS